MGRRSPPDLRCRLALRIPEAADALGVSESALRRNLPSLGDAVIRVGGQVRITVQGLERYVGRMEDEARKELESLAGLDADVRQEANDLLGDVA